MAILGYTKDEFGEKLATVVNAATPIRSIQHLKGREQQLQEIERAPTSELFLLETVTWKLIGQSIQN